MGVKGDDSASGDLGSEVTSQDKCLWQPLTSYFSTPFVMADSQQLPSSKRTRLAEDGVDEPDYSIPSGGSTAVEAPPSRADKLDHSHAKR